MATFKIFDRADEFRVELIGRFAGGCIPELRTAWRKALGKTIPRQFTVDLARVSGWDAEGRNLLCEMYQHGTQFAAGNAESLVFLREISTAASRGPLLVPEVAPRQNNGSATTPKTRSKAVGG